MTISRQQFDAIANSTSPQYQLEYKQKALEAVKAYLIWTKSHTHGIRFFTRFGHLSHGKSGKLRATALKTSLENPEHSFSDVVYQVGNTLIHSSLAIHSLHRYMCQSLTGDPVACAAVTKENFFKNHCRNKSLTLNMLNQTQDLNQTDTWKLTMTAYAIARADNSGFMDLAIGMALFTAEVAPIVVVTAATIGAATQEHNRHSHHHHHRH